MIIKDVPEYHGITKRCGGFIIRESSDDVSKTIYIGGAKTPEQYKALLQLRQYKFIRKGDMAAAMKQSIDCFILFTTFTSRKSLANARKRG